MAVVFLNGEYLPLEEARVSVLDRGFTFGDGVYEIIPVFNGGVFLPAEHLQRLNSSLSAINIDNPYSVDDWRRIIDELLRSNPTAGPIAMYLQITRGVSERDHLYGDDIRPTVFAMCKTVPERDLSRGVSAVTHEDIRWKYCSIKTTALLSGVLLKKYARDQDGAMEAILLRDDMLTEGAASNVFVVCAGVIRTPPTDGLVLAGITRDLLVHLLREAGLACEETGIHRRELQAADEIWITSSTMGVVAVVRLDGVPVGEGKPGAQWLRARQLYENFKSSRHDKRAFAGRDGASA